MIDKGISSSGWPEPVLADIKKFEQGDLVENPPFFYVASARHGVWHLTRGTGDPELEAELFEMHPDDCPPLGIITTETCDLVEEDAKEPRQPWFSVSPVYVLEEADQNRISLIEENRISYFRRLTASDYSDKLWIADFRIEFPVEKSWIVGREPIQAFSTLEEKLALAEFLAERRNRPVLARNIHTQLIVPLRRWLEHLKVDRRATVLQGVHEVRLEISGNPLDPDGLGLVIVGETVDVPQAARTEWNAKWENWKERLNTVNISLVHHEYATLDTLSARRYRDSYRIPIAFS